MFWMVFWPNPSNAAPVYEQQDSIHYTHQIRMQEAHSVVFKHKHITRITIQFYLQYGLELALHASLVLQFLF